MKLFSDLEQEKIVWSDITQCPSTWATAEEIEYWYSDAAEALVEQAGYVIFEDEHNLIVADSYIESLEIYGTITKIPKAVIKSRYKATGWHES